MKNHNLWWELILLAVTFGLLLLAWKWFPLGDLIQDLMSYTKDAGIWAPAVFVMIYGFAALIGIPRAPINVGAGVIFPFPESLLLVLGSNILAFVATFQIARHYARDWVERRLEKIPAAQHMMKAVDKNGFRIVLLTQLNPLIPAVIKGYGFGTTAINFRTYISASVLGFLPVAGTYVYLGWVGGTAVKHSSDHPTDWQAGLLIGIAVAGAVVLASLAWYAHKYSHKHVRADF